MKVPAVVLSVALGALAALPPVADAQVPPRAPRVAVLTGARMSWPPLEVFRRTLRERGWVEGQSVILEWRLTEGKAERYPDLVAEVVGLKADVIVTTGDVAAIAAKRATTTIPIVCAGCVDPVATGLVASLAKPGGNVTGSSFEMTVQLIGKHFQLLKEVAPALSRVAMLWNPVLVGTAATDLYAKEGETAARALGLTRQLLPVRRREDVEGALAAMTRERAEALLIYEEGVLARERDRIIEVTTQRRLPTLSSLEGFAEAGGLMSHGPDNRELLRRTAEQVDKILRGAKPADLPVELPTRYVLVINLKTARALGLAVPQSLLVQADKLIQ